MLNRPLDIANLYLIKTRQIKGKGREIIMRLRPVLAVFVLSLMALPLSAQVWEVYDNFDGPVIDPALWTGNWVAYGGSALDFERQVQNSFLWLGLRGYGSTFTDGVTNWGMNSVEVTQPILFKGIKAKLKIVQALGNSPYAACGQVTLRARFFNTGTSEPRDPNNDIEACLFMMSGGQEGQPLSVGGLLRQFGPGPSDLASVNLGTINVGEVVNVWVRWDKPNKKLFFGLQGNRKNAQPVEMAIDYSTIVSDGLPPGNPYRSIQAQTSPVSNTSFQTYSDMLVKIDQVSVIR
jgi:hypothetical protein